MKTKDGMRCILDALLAHACRETVIDWAIEQACGRFRSEILHISRVESGLHFNASQACTANILNFDLEEIAQMLEVLAPCTWCMVQGLLNSNPVACQGRVATKSAIYENSMILLKGHSVIYQTLEGVGEVKGEWGA